MEKSRRSFLERFGLGFLGTIAAACGLGRSAKAENETLEIVTRDKPTGGAIESYGGRVRTLMIQPAHHSPITVHLPCEEPLAKSFFETHALIGKQFILQNASWGPGNPNYVELTLAPVDRVMFVCDAQDLPVSAETIL